MKKVLVLILITCSLSSCFISLHPLYTEKDLVLEDKLSGIWKDKNPNEASNNKKVEIETTFDGKKLLEEWTFVSAGKKNNTKHKGFYDLKHSSQEDYAYDYEVAFLKLGSHYFIDVYPKEFGEDEEQATLAFFLATHNFYKVKFKDDKEIEIFAIDIDRFEKLVKQRKIRIKHEIVDDNIVITASTSDLQKFILKYAEDEDAFEEPLSLYNH